MKSFIVDASKGNKVEVRCGKFRKSFSTLREAIHFAMNNASEKIVFKLVDNKQVVLTLKK